MAFPITNYHTHTSRCKHAQGTDRDYVQQAVDSGYQVLGFTDHVAWPFSDGFVSPVRMDASQMPEYAASILKLKEEYAGRLSIHLGAECGVSHPGGPLSPQRGGVAPVRRGHHAGGAGTIYRRGPGGDGERAVRLPVPPGPAFKELSQV